MELAMNRSKSLLKNTFILGIGKLFSKVLVFIMVPLYSRWLSTGDYGTFDLYTTYISLLVPLLTLSCGEAVFRYLLDADENFDKKRIISSGFAIIFVSSIIGFLIVCCYFVKNQRGMMIPFVIYLLADSLYSFLTAYLRGIKKISLYAISSIICVFSTFIFVTALVYFCGFGLIGIIYGYALAYCLSALFIIIKTRFFEYISFDMIKILEVKRLLKYSAPLVPNSISWWIVNGSDRTIINIVLGSTFNGIYAIANKVPAMCTTLFSVFHLSWQENASSSINDEDRDYYFSNIMNKMLIELLSISICITSINFILFDYIFDAKYKMGYFHVPILITSVIFSVLSQYFGGIFIGLKEPKYNGITTVLAAVVNILINVSFINTIGLYAASGSTLIAYIFLCLIRYFIIKQKVNLQFKRSLIKYLFIYIYFIIAVYIDNLYLNILNIFLAGLLFLFINRNMIKSILVYFTSKIQLLNNTNNKF